MKACFILLPVFVALAAKAEPTNAPPQAAPESLQTEAAKPSRETPPVIKELKPNEIEAGNLTYSGILVEAVKVDNPLQLINPAAPKGSRRTRLDFERRSSRRSADRRFGILRMTSWRLSGT